MPTTNLARSRHVINAINFCRISLSEGVLLLMAIWSIPDYEIGGFLSVMGHRVSAILVISHATVFQHLIGWSRSDKQRRRRRSGIFVPTCNSNTMFKFVPSSEFIQLHAP